MANSDYPRSEERLGQINSNVYDKNFYSKETDYVVT